MTRPLTVRRQAQAQVTRAAKWYEDQRAGLGGRLLDDARRTFDAIRARPERFPVVHGPARRALLARFPYAVYFLTTDTRSWSSPFYTVARTATPISPAGSELAFPSATCELNRPQ